MIALTHKKGRILTSKGLKSDMKEARAAYLFILPWLIGLIIFTLGPFIYSLFLSFNRTDIFSRTWIGLENYINLFTKDEVFVKSILITMRYVLISVPLKLVFALAVAMLLKDNIKGLSIYRTIYYLPSLVGASVAIAVTWSKMFSSDGMVNIILNRLGIEGTNWIGDPDTSLWVLIILVVWQFGSSMVIFLAGLKNVPNQLYEACAIDGGNALHKFRFVTLPMISPVIQFNLVLQVIGSFQMFTQSFIITKGGPMNETKVAVLYIYEKAFQGYKMGYASAISWILLLVIAIITGIIFFVSNKYVHYES